MKILMIGSGISGLCAAIEAAAAGHTVELVSPFPSERSQSVMAAGGINGAYEAGKDSPILHAEDTFLGGGEIENRETLLELCSAAPEQLRFLTELGVRFNREPDGTLSRRTLGGHSQGRTAYAGLSTGKQIVTALVNKCREYEIRGSVKRTLGLHFYRALIREGVCYGALFCSEEIGTLLEIRADVTVMATGGMNRMFGRTTGSTLCDGYCTGKLLEQGVALRNLEFIQYHPTAVKTESKRMLISETARGEGGRLFYLRPDGTRCYFMEERFGPKGNLMPRDVVSRCVYDCPSRVYLDITFPGKEGIRERLGEIDSLCREYLGLDPAREPIPVSPAVHFFMGGIRVDGHHRTNIQRLYAVGECASCYHGANRLGGNSLLTAIYSGRKAAGAIHASEQPVAVFPDFSRELAEQEEYFQRLRSAKSRYPAVFLLNDLCSIMTRNLGIVRDRERLEEGLAAIALYRESAKALRFDPSVSLYENYRLPALLLLGEAVLRSALGRQESRGAHFRRDFPEEKASFRGPSVISLEGEKWNLRYEISGEVTL